MAMNICVIVPSRGRPQNLDRLQKAFKDTKATADLYAILDLDDPKVGEYSTTYAKIIEHNTTGGAAKPMQTGFKKLLNDSMYKRYEYFIVLGDDALPQTDHWDVKMREVLIDKTGFSYVNDLLQGANLMSHICVTRDVVTALVKFGMPKVQHLFLDNFLTKLAQDINGCYYSDSIVIEHLHPLVGKADWDEGYERVNNKDLYVSDEKIVNEYVASQTYQDLVNFILENKK